MSSIKYVKAFDGLRGLAVLMLFFYHFPGRYIFIRHGWEFLQMFFVMSGYLISLTLLEDREKYPFKQYAVSFYIKRALRLFPLYFAFIFLCLILNAISHDTPVAKASVGDVTEQAKYLLTFSYNFMPIINHALGKGYDATLFTKHLWTISLEEQFYLVFPLIFFFFNISTIKKIIVALIIIAPVFRVLMFLYMRHSNPGDLAWASINLSRIPFAQMDSLAFGAALALFNTDWIKNAMRWWSILLLIIVLAYLGNIYYVYRVQGLDFYKVTFGLKIAEKWITHNYFFSYIITLVNMWCALTLLCVRRNERIVPPLEFKPLVFLGKLSYGIYVVHPPLLGIIAYLQYIIFNGKQLHPYILHETVLFVIFFSTSVGIAYLSFTYFESYFLRLKKKLKRTPVLHG